MLGVTMNDAAAFASDYATARRNVLREGSRWSAKHAAHGLTERGPAGEELACDTLWFGPSDARDVLVLVSGTHGVEGFCGSGAQADWLREGGPSALPRGCAALLVHALNPHGFACLRRVTQEGVDLNRNAVDFATTPPANPAYDELADAFVPPSLAPDAMADADRVLAAYAASHGARALEAARTSGQYGHPHGVFYGGTEPAEALRLIGHIAAEHHLGARRGVAVVDYHTGLGPYGYGEPICGHRPGESGQARARAWYGPSLGEPLLGSSAALPVTGLTQLEWGRRVGPERLTFVALEYGTYPTEQGAAALRADHVLHRGGAVDVHAEETRRVKAALRRFYHPDRTDWREAVLLRSRQVIAQALAGLAAGPAAFAT